MAKFYGPIGYGESRETTPGVWTDVITEYDYNGDILKDTSRSQASDKLNDDLRVNVIISVLADPFAYQNFQAIRYVKWMGASWKVTNVEVLRPRLQLTIGGVYNGEEA